MKSLNFQEFYQYVQWCESTLKGAQLQSVSSSKDLLVFEFYKFGEYSLVLDLETQNPQLILLQNLDFEIKKSQSPVALFLSSHARNLRLRSLNSLPDFGRVCKINLDSGDENEGKKCEIEICMVPRIPNVTARAAGKTISWNRPVEMIRMVDQQVEVASFEGDWSSRGQEWFETFQGSKKNKVTPVRDLENILNKKRKALVQLKNSLDSNEEEINLRKYAEALASHQPLETQLSMYSNLTISQAYERIKKIGTKKVGTEKRIQILEAEILKLSSGSANREESTEPKVSLASKRMEKTGTKGRKLKLSGNSEAVIGKSGKDNLMLLRQARAWDYWLHIKDYPGAHAIIFRDRNASISEIDINKVAAWLVRESPSARGLELGISYDIILAECRYVKPLKGDRLGRVTYSEHKIFRFIANGD